MTVFKFNRYCTHWNDTFRLQARYRRYEPSCILYSTVSPVARCVVVGCSVGSHGLIHHDIASCRSADFFQSLHPTILHNTGILSWPWIQASAKRTPTVSCASHILSVAPSALVDSSSVPEGTHCNHPVTHIFFLQNVQGGLPSTHFIVKKLQKLHSYIFQIMVSPPIIPILGDIRVGARPTFSCLMSGTHSTRALFQLHV
jgi:hypothetical protein